MSMSGLRDTVDNPASYEGSLYKGYPQSEEEVKSEELNREIGRRERLVELKQGFDKANQNTSVKIV